MRKIIMILDDIVEVHYLGPEGTYSELATKRLIEKMGINSKLIPEVNYNQVAKKVNSKEGILGVLPLKKRTASPVQPHYDAIYLNNLNIVGAQRLALEFALGVHPESTNQSVLKTHQQAYNSCCDYLSEVYPNSRLISTSSTAEGVRMVAESKEGIALAHPDTLRDYGLRILDVDIDNMSRSGQGKDYTDFMLLSDEVPLDLKYDPNKNYESIVAYAPYEDYPALLAKALLEFGLRGINLSDIHSRNLLNPLGEEINNDRKMFYIEVQESLYSDKMQNAMDSIERMSTRCAKAIIPMGTYEELPNV
jgi:prephenate dehydratase